MKNKLRKLAYRYFFFNFIYRLLFKILNYRFKTIDSKTKIFQLSELNKLSKDISIYPHEFLADNELYGNAYWLRKYCDFKKPLLTYMEHGLYLGSLVNRDEISSFPKNIITFSDYRENYILKKTNKNIIKIGPYIHYAEDYFEKDYFENLKKKFGKVLLVFPNKSFKSIIKKYDFKELIDEINHIKKNFDNVIINLFWRDIIEGREELFKKEGYIVYSAGHVNDVNFLSRLKSIIKLSDVTMSNKVGTQLGYSIYLNKPHYIFNQKEERISTNKKYSKIDQGLRTDEDKLTLEKDLKLLTDAFSYFSTTISKEQQAIVEHYWGLSHIKSKSELFQILNSLY